MIIGCDPGLKGALALLDGDRLEIVDMPTHKERVNGSERDVFDAVGATHQITLMKARGATAFVIEQVGGLPGQSAPAAFNFGFGVGVLLTAARFKGLHIERVWPQEWKAAMRVPRDKRGARQRATELMPAHAHLWPLQKHDGRAEAAMIALWASRHVL